MAQRFTSNFTAKVDDKGRVSVPASFRRVLESEGAEGRLHLVPGFRNPRSVEGYAPSGFEAMAAMIARMHPADRNRRKLEYKFLGQSMDMQVDDTGRIVLPRELREAMGIGDRALFIGTGESFQIWAPEAHEAAMAELFADEDEGGDPLASMPWPGAEA